MSDTIIQIKDVNKWFGDFQVLKDINLNVEKNKKIVVCGPSGSGKSTLLNLISLIDKPSTGSRKLDNIKINDDDNGNDFEKVIKKLEPDFNSIYNKMDNLEDTIFTRLTGSGSCIFSVFENKLKAENAKNSFLKTYPNLWVAVAENNNIKL